jgi:hypothetical protein
MSVSLQGLDAALLRAGLLRSGPALGERDQARNSWLRGHLVAMARLVDDSGVELEWSESTELSQLLTALLQVMGLQSSVVQTISELLSLMDEVEALEEDQTGALIPPPSLELMSPGAQAAWMSRLCSALSRGEEVFPWRVGEDPGELKPDYLVGAPPPTPPVIDEI